jgi:hypothetical protein
MTSACLKLTIGAVVNGAAASFLAYALLSDGADFEVGASRTYVVLTMIAPMLIVLLLTAPLLLRGAAVLGTVTVLLLAGMVLAQLQGSDADRPLPKSAAEATEGKLARY